MSMWDILGPGHVQQLQGIGEEIWSLNIHDELSEPVDHSTREAVSVSGLQPVFFGKTNVSDFCQFFNRI